MAGLPQGLSNEVEPAHEQFKGRTCMAGEQIFAGGYTCLSAAAATSGSMGPSFCISETGPSGGFPARQEGAPSRIGPRQ
jgi:hypothetical protein